MILPLNVLFPVTVVVPVRVIALPFKATVLPELPITVLPALAAVLMEVLPEMELFALLMLTAVPLTLTVAPARAPIFTVAA